MQNRPVQPAAQEHSPDRGWQLRWAEKGAWSRTEGGERGGAKGSPAYLSVFSALQGQDWSHRSPKSPAGQKRSSQLGPLKPSLHRHAPLVGKHLAPFWQSHLWEHWGPKEPSGHSSWHLEQQRRGGHACPPLTPG